MWDEKGSASILSPTPEVNKRAEEISSCKGTRSLSAQSLSPVVRNSHPSSRSRFLFRTWFVRSEVTVRVHDQIIPGFGSAPFDIK